MVFVISMLDPRLIFLKKYHKIAEKLKNKNTCYKMIDRDFKQFS